MTYHQPATAAEACRLAAEFGAGAAFLAGGTELLVLLKNRRIAVPHVISLKNVPELNSIRAGADGLTIGAMATANDVARSPLIRAQAPALADAAAAMAGEQVRNMATIGGNFCAGVPCADLPTPCLVVDAELRVQSISGPRRVKANGFFTGPRQTILKPGDLVIAVSIPPLPPHTGTSYHRFARRKANALAVAGVAVRLTLKGGVIADARVALGAVAPTPMLAENAARVLIGHAPDGSRFEDAARTAAAEARPITDVRGSAEFRRELVAVLARRALHDALRLARQTSEPGA